MVEPPLELAGIEVECYGRVGVIRRAIARSARRPHPRLGLRHAPIGQVQIEIDAARDPRIAARAEQVRQLTPGVAARIARFGDGVELPDQLSGLRVVGADEALLLAILIARAAAQALDHLALGDNGSAAGAVVAQGAVADRGLPHFLAGTRIQREDDGRSGRHVDFVVVDRQPALRVPGGRFADAVLPDQFTGLGIQRLHDIARVIDEHGPVVDHRSGLIGALIHRPGPDQAQILHVVRGDLVQRAEIVGAIVVADHQPVGRIRIAHHRVGDGRVVLHVAWNGQAPGSRRRSATAARRRSGSSFTLFALFPLTALNLSDDLAGNATNRDRRIAGERLVPSPRAVRLQDERGDIQVVLLT